jgi:hypothetical protein
MTSERPDIDTYRPQASIVKPPADMLGERQHVSADLQGCCPDLTLISRRRCRFADHSR